MLWLLAPVQGQLSPLDGKPIFTGPTEMFHLSIRLAILGGCLAALPVLVSSVLWLFWPLLNRQQKLLAVLFVPSAFVCYLCGAAYTYWVLLPTGFGFLLTFGADVAVPMIRITEYMDLAIAMLFWLGLIFELPLLMLLATKLRVVSYKRFRSIRRYVPVMALILAAIITPTSDVINWLLVAAPISVLYEVGLFVALLARPKGKG